MAKILLVLLALLAVCLTYVNASADKQDSVGEPAEKNLFKFLIFREDCFDHFLNFNFGHEDCTSITISKILGYIIILGAIGVKLPQIIGLINSKSGDGVLPSMFYSENFLLILNATYSIHLGSPFSVYGENFFILVQNIVIIILLWKYQKGNSFLTKFLVTTVTSGFFILLFTDIYVPKELWGYLMQSQIFVMSYSKIPQILQNFKSGSTGQLAFITFFVNMVGNLARLFTVFTEANDFLFMLSIIASFVFNFTLTMQIIFLGGDSKVEEKKDVKAAYKPSSRGSKRKID